MTFSYYHNEKLFSEIYLEEITDQAEQSDVLTSLGVLKEYREFADTSTLEVWKTTYVHEVLSALGFNVQAKTKHISSLYPLGSSDALVSVCFIVLPEESLDNTLMGRNWMEKSVRVLREQSLTWGLLTNGKQWRILHVDEQMPYETYLEINLEGILRDRVKDAYQIFHKFMNVQNFLANGSGKCQFDNYKKESQDKIDYIEKELANALRQREEGGKGVLSDICMGYVDELRRRNEGDLDDELFRQKIYHGAMLYMFRLLFLLYSEARGLLSRRNHDLLILTEEDCQAFHTGKKFESDEFIIWNRLETIFVDIDQTYNGGLFSPQESEFTRFIEDEHIKNHYLAEAIFNLTIYREKNGGQKVVSYRDMSVRHLGTLYEGLLEHKLFIANEDTEVKASKGKVEFIPNSKGGKLIKGHFLNKGSVYFAGDPSERKSTGSYYTPEYIVDYIVRNTVGNKLSEMKRAFLARENANLEAYFNAIDETERVKLSELVEDNFLEFIRQNILTLSVLDPAMGSGHFLVSTTNLISNFITELFNQPNIESNLSTDTEYWRRWVVENCIYGVDLNPLAVELAKLSLWILSMAKDQPLSFLNHHLKCGNSLVGSQSDDIGNYPFSTIKKEPTQLKLFERDPNFRAAVEEVISKSHLIAAKGSISLDYIKEKKVWLEEIEQALAGYKAICDIHTDLFFGNRLDESQYSRIVNNKDFTTAISLKQKSYFHWELEYPLLLDNNRGFDCVIGNPPYGVNLLTSEKKYFYFTFNQSNDVSLDSYEAFILKGLNLLKENGTLSLILPSTWLYMPTFYNLRKYLLKNFAFDQIRQYRVPVFSGVTVETCISVIRKMKPENGQEMLFWEISGSEKKHEIPIKIKQQDIYNSKTLNLHQQSNEKSNNLFERIGSKYQPLGYFTKIVCGIKPYQKGKGVPPQTNEIVNNRVFDGSYKKDETYRQYIMGRDFQRYRWQIGQERWLSYGKWLAEPRLSAPFNNKEKIVIRQTADEIIAHIDINQYLSLNNVHNLILVRETLSLKYLLGILNSRLITWWYRQLMPEQGRVFAEVKVINLNKLPIRDIDPYNSQDFELRSELEKYVTELLKLNQSNHEVIELGFQKMVDNILYNIDSIVYKLYGLSQDEIALIDQEIND